MRIVVRAGRYRRAIPSRVLRTGRDTTPSVQLRQPRRPRLDARAASRGRRDAPSASARRARRARAIRARRRRRRTPRRAPRVSSWDGLPPRAVGVLRVGGGGGPRVPPRPVRSAREAPRAALRFRHPRARRRCAHRHHDARVRRRTRRRARARRPRQPPRPRSTRQKVDTPRASHAEDPSMDFHRAPRRRARRRVPARIRPRPRVANKSIGPHRRRRSSRAPRPARRRRFRAVHVGLDLAPKGVLVGHAHLTHNCALIRRNMRVTERDVNASWLPQYHDMGLVGGYPRAAHHRGRRRADAPASTTCVFASPGSFMRDPTTWPLIMSKYRATMTQAPDFAYRLCAERWEGWRAERWRASPADGRVGRMCPRWICPR